MLSKTHVTKSDRERRQSKKGYRNSGGLLPAPIDQFVTAKMHEIIRKLCHHVLQEARHQLIRERVGWVQRDVVDVGSVRGTIHSDVRIGCGIEIDERRTTEWSVEDSQLTQAPGGSMAGDIKLGHHANATLGSIVHDGSHVLSGVHCKEEATRSATTKR
jgi:hypothetical protein